ncbi:MAG: DUF4322 domain-containing protein, partial [Nitrososphaeria archaeon]
HEIQNSYSPQAIPSWKLETHLARWFPSKRPRMANHPRRDEARLAGYKLVSPLSFRGRKGDAAARTLVSASIWRDSAEGRSGTCGVSARCPEPRGGPGARHDQGFAGGAKEIDLSLDWTGMRYYGKYAEGLGSGDGGYPWNYATATAKMQGQDAAASSPHVRG